MLRTLPRWVPFLVVFSAVAGVAHAQSGTAADPGKGYAEVVAQSAFGNVTSQNYGVEVGFTISPSFQVFGEIGHTRDVASDAFGAAAQTIAGQLPQSQSPGYSVKQPLTFGVGGLKYLFPTGSEHLLPYAMLGFGVAKVENDATFTLGGADVTGNLAQYGIVLGSDLSGSFTKPMFTLGAGASYVGWHAVVFDFQFRYGHVFADGESINVSRAGLGLGFRF